MQFMLASLVVQRNRAQLSTAVTVQNNHQKLRWWNSMELPTWSIRKGASSVKRVEIMILGHSQRHPHEFNT